MLKRRAALCARQRTLCASPREGNQQEELRMKFKLNHAPDVINQHIDVQVEAENDELILKVSSDLDASNLASDLLDPPCVQYERSFRQVGTRSPGRTNKLIVTADDQNGKQETSTKIWQD
jgi:hypothetical protein